MLYEELKLRNNIVLKEEDEFNFAYILYKIKKEEVEGIFKAYNKYSISKKIEEDGSYSFVQYLDMIGTINDLTLFQVKNLIPKIKDWRVKSLISDLHYDIPEYKCYQSINADQVHNNIILHECPLSSFKCACKRIEAEYFLVLRLNDLNVYRRSYIQHNIEGDEVLKSLEDGDI